MKKRFISIFIVCAVLLCGCSEKTKTVDLKTMQESEINNTEVVYDEKETTEEKPELIDKDVDIVLSMYLFDDSITIEEYVNNLKEENPDKIYSVYDETHYIQTIKESVRKELLKEFNSEEYIDRAFKDIFSDEQYNGAYLTMEYDAYFQNITLYVDKVAYDNAGPFVTLGPLLISGAFSDIIQAYNLIPIEEREFKLLIIDESNKEVIYDSSEKSK